MFAEMRRLMNRVEADQQLKVLVFDSANPDYFVAHIDPGLWREVVDDPDGAPCSERPEVVSRMIESRVISIASIRGRARGHGNEFTLACDMRFASRERAVFGQLEVPLGVVPGGGGFEWLSALDPVLAAVELTSSPLREVAGEAVTSPEREGKSGNCRTLPSVFAG